jgi:hypothetical protein
MMVRHNREMKMRSALIVVALAGLSLALSGCAFLYGGNEGNPYNDAYIGSSGSTYDVKANPPRTIGVVTYDPMAPLPGDDHGTNTATGISANSYAKP